MKYNIKLHLVALATVFVLSFLILVPSEAFADPLTITETRITTSGSATNPDIYGNTIAWQDTRNGGNDVYMYDIPTKKETRITTSGSATTPSIYGNLIVWSDGRNGNGEDVYLYDLSSKKETRITTSSLWYVTPPKIYSNIIMWSCSGDIYTYDLSTMKETQITTGWDPAIYNNRIVFSRDSGSSPEPLSDVYLYDLSTKKEIQIATYLWESNLRIYGNMILWVESYEMTEPGWGPEPDILMYDISTGETQSIINGASNFEINGNRIVRSNNSNIYMYDLSMKKETQITKSGSASNPRIYVDRILWQDSRNGGSDIYLGTLSSSSNSLVADFSASPTSGKAPLIVNFTDKSTGSPTSWLWTFGDGTSSKEQNPVHKYTKSGNYSVTLRVWNKTALSTVTKSNYISVTNPVADFSASPTYGKAPLTVNFKDKSEGLPNCWYWNFGDGTSSNLQNPVHKYNKSGNYTVMLRVWSGAAMSSINKNNFISVISPPVAAFYATPISGKAPLAVKFIDKSTGLPKSWYWDFGDGSTSNSQNPTHTYTVGGYRKYYTVSLTVQNEAGNNTKKTYNYISVTK
ncbi:MAG: hypothetical protein QG646_2150 [Euryarchaeota archaeon]|nr:hypothetical protein [Euryarchaeota archaeon]